MLAADREVFSRQVPTRMISSFTLADFSALVSPHMSQTRTTFSPRKLRISTHLPPFVTLTLMGKWLYTRRILISKRLETPVIMLETWEQNVRRQDRFLDTPCHMTTRILPSLTS